MKTNDFRYKESLHLERKLRGDGGLLYVEKAYTVVFKLDGVDVTYTVPAGTWTDFASIPQFFQRYVSKLGPHIEAAVCHDRLCLDRGMIRDDLIVSSATVAGIFNEAMRAAGVSTFTREVMYRAVLWFGPKWSVREMRTAA